MYSNWTALTLLVLVGCGSKPVPNVGPDTPVPTTLDSSTAAPAVNPNLASIAKQLTSADVEERRTAAYEMGQKVGRDGVPHLITALDDADLQVRVYALQSLRDLRDERAVGRLCELLNKSSTEPLIVSNVMRALGAIRSSQALPALFQSLESSEPFTRYDAAQALGDIGDPAAIPALTKLLSDQTMPERRGPTGGLESTVYSIAEQAQRAIDRLTVP